MLLMILIICLIGIGISYGLRKKSSIEVYVEINDFSLPYYNFGFSFKEVHKGIEELLIGGIIINISIRFYKEII